MNALALLAGLNTSAASSIDIKQLRDNCYDALNDDLNSPILIAHLFDGAKMINSVNDGNATITTEDLKELQQLYSSMVYNVLGLQQAIPTGEGANGELFGQVVDLLLALRQEAKIKKDWALSDQIRNQLTALGFEIKDTKEGADWKLKK